MNLLILSVGTRNKLVQYFNKELGSQGNVICTDMSEYAPALYEGDIYYLLPAIKDENYLERLLSICKKEHIDAVFSLIDPEISILLNNQSLLNNCGVKILHPNTE
ncbi:carbamoyl phosphate synthase, partial [Staphylococcus chromogenes]